MKHAKRHLFTNDASFRSSTGAIGRLAASGLRPEVPEIQRRDRAQAEFRKLKLVEPIHCFSRLWDSNAKILERKKEALEVDGAAPIKTGFGQFNKSHSGLNTIQRFSRIQVKGLRQVLGLRVMDTYKNVRTCAAWTLGTVLCFVPFMIFILAIMIFIN